MFYKKIKTSIQEQIAAENNAAMVAKQQAVIDYIAMMAEIEIPVEEAIESKEGIEDA